MSKLYAVKMTAGNVAIVRLLNDKAKIEDQIKRPFDSYVEISENDIPDDRVFRDSWVLDGGNISHDMDKARDIQMNRIREKRDAALKALDIETMKGVDVQDEKQILRDIPQTFDLSTASTVNELKSLWPEGLND